MTTTTTTWVGTTGYHLSARELRTVREMAKAAGTSWKALAARPMLAHAWLSCYYDAACSIEGGLRRVLERVARNEMPC